jgi:hypothetical protein
MKSVLLALAVILACVVYEADRESRLAADWHPQAEVDRVLNGQLRAREAWTPREVVPDGAATEPMPRDDYGPGTAPGRIERENSIRLFGPGVSRKQQIRV